MKKRSPFTFFLLVFGLSIPIWIIERFIKIKGLPLDIPITDVVAAFTPLIAACILIHREEGRGSVKKLQFRVFDFSRIKHTIWYFPIFLLPFLTFFLIYLVMYTPKLPLPEKLHIPILTMPLFFVFFFIGAVAEEVGYMGYAVEPMQERWNALTTSLIMGILWAIWHYPSIIKQGHDALWIA